MELTIKEYMEKYGVKSTQTIYNRIDKGTLNSYTKDGRRIIVVEDEIDTEKGTDNQENEILKKEIEYLKKQSEDLKTDKEDLKKRLDEAEKKAEQSNHLLMAAQGNLKNLTNTIQQLEYKKQEVEKELQDEKNKKWWQKIFTKN